MNVGEMLAKLIVTKWSVGDGRGSGEMLAKLIVNKWSVEDDRGSGEMLAKLPRCLTLMECCC